MARRRDKRPIDELRTMSDADLVKELDEAQRQLFTARLQLTTRQLANTSLPHKTRQRRAQIMTIMRERELAAAAQPAMES